MNSREVYKHQKKFERKNDCQTLLISSGFRKSLKTVQILGVQNEGMLQFCDGSVFHFFLISLLKKLETKISTSYH